MGGKLPKRRRAAGAVLTRSLETRMIPFRSKGVQPSRWKAMSHTPPSVGLKIGASNHYQAGTQRFFGHTQSIFAATIHLLALMLSSVGAQESLARCTLSSKVYRDSLARDGRARLCPEKGHRCSYTVG